MTIPVVALVGRPNVGKSTLFNVLTKTQHALVADFPGLTRDRQYGDVHFGNHSFAVIDTGGMGIEDESIDALMLKQSELALQEASRIFFLVDARAGLTGLDEKIVQKLRKLGKPIDLIINKVDGLDAAVVSAEFRALGLASYFCISSAHGHGITDLLSTITKDFQSDGVQIPDDAGIRVTLVGRPNVGKSTLVNRILGEERVVVYDQPGTTRDSIAIPFEREDQRYVLVDTAGLRRRGRIHEKIEKFSVVKTLQSIKSSEVCVMLIDGREGLTEQDMHLLSFIIEAGKALVVAVNKWDGLTLDHKRSVEEEIARKLHFVHFAKIRYISALHGSGVGILFKDILQAYRAATQTFSTPKVTRLLQDIVATHEPPLVKGRRIKLRYAHVGGHQPPTIVIHGNQLQALPESYRRYLMNALTAQLKLVGTPLRLEFKSGTNPYREKSNVLTERQQKKKKRLMRWVKRH